MFLAFLDMLYNLAYVKNVSKTGFFKVELDFKSQTMYLFDRDQTMARIIKKTFCKR